MSIKVTVKSKQYVDYMAVTTTTGLYEIDGEPNTFVYTYVATSEPTTLYRSLYIESDTDRVEDLSECWAVHRFYVSDKELSLHLSNG